MARQGTGRAGPVSLEFPNKDHLIQYKTTTIKKDRGRLHRESPILRRWPQAASSPIFSMHSVDSQGPRHAPQALGEGPRPTASLLKATVGVHGMRLSSLDSSDRCRVVSRLLTRHPASRTACAEPAAVRRGAGEGGHFKHKQPAALGGPGRQVDSRCTQEHHHADLVPPRAC